MKKRKRLLAILLTAAMTISEAGMVYAAEEAVFTDIGSDISYGNDTEMFMDSGEESPAEDSSGLLDQAVFEGGDTWQEESVPGMETDETPREDLPVIWGDAGESSEVSEAAEASEKGESGKESEAGEVSQEDAEIFAGETPETLTGGESDEVFEETPEEAEEPELSPEMQSAEGEFDWNGLHCKLNEQGEVIILEVIKDIHYNKDGSEKCRDRCLYTNGTIPASINGHPVKEINSGAFSECINLTKVTLPDSLCMIGAGAFRGCTSLTSVNIPKDMETHQYMGERAYPGAFADCTSLTSVTFGKGIERIPQGLFQSCSGLREILIPDTVKEIRTRAFENCANLQSVKLPEGMEKINWYAFSNCKSLKEIHLPSSLVYLDTGAFAGCTSLAAVNIPPKTETNGNTAANKMYPGPFPGCASLKKVTFDKGIEKIPAGLFYASDGVEIEEINLPEGVKIIGHDVFYNCHKLKKVTLPRSLETIENSAFGKCQTLTEVQLPEKLKRIGSFAFADCSGLTGVKLPDSLDFLGIGAFQNCILIKEIRIPVHMDTDIDTGRSMKEPGPFAGCTSLKTVSFAEGIEKIPTGLFYMCSAIEKITIPKTVKSLESMAFGRTSLKNVELSPGLMKIGRGAFYRCESLESLELPNTVETIEMEAFQACCALKYVMIPASAKVISDWDTFDGVPSDFAIRGLTGSYAEKYAKENNIPFVAVGTVSPSGVRVTFNKNSSKAKLDASKKTKTVYTGKAYGTLPVPTLKNYVFLGWYTAKSGGKKVTEKTKVSLSKKHTLYARWKKGGYLTYKLNGGKNHKKNTAYYYSDKGLKLQSPTRKGYVFGGWFTNKKFTAKSRIKEIKKKSVGNKTLYAKWSPVTYTVKYSPNASGVTGKVKNSTHTYGKAKKLSANAYKRKGYVFAGWNTRADGKGTSYKDKQSVKNLASVKGKTVTLYAKWAKKKVTISAKAISKTCQTGTKCTLTAKCNSNEKSFLWSSSNKLVATVDKNGVVAFHSPGTVTITAKTKDKSAKGSIKLEADGMSFLSVRRDIVQGSKVDKGVHVSEWKLMDGTVRNSSSSAPLASQYGISTKESITQTAKFDTRFSFGKLKKDLNLVNAKESVTIENNFGMQSAASPYVALYYRERYQLYEYKAADVYTSLYTKETLKKEKEKVYTIETPKELTADDYRWVYDQNFKDSPKAIKLSNPVSVSGKIPVKAVYLDCDSVTLRADSRSKLDSEYQLTAFLLPQMATNEKVAFKSSNPKVAAVSSQGKITAKSAGKAVITATASGGNNVKATCSVTVTGKSGSLSDTSGFRRSYQVLNKQVGDRVKVYRRKTEPVLIRSKGEQAQYTNWMGEETLQSCSVSLSSELPLKSIAKDLEGTVKASYDWKKETVKLSYTGAASYPQLQNVYVSYYVPETYQLYHYKVKTTEYNSANKPVNTRESTHTMLVLLKDETAALGIYSSPSLKNLKTIRNSLS